MYSIRSMSFNVLQSREVIDRRQPVADISVLNTKFCVIESPPLVNFKKEKQHSVLNTKFC